MATLLAIWRFLISAPGKILAGLAIVVGAYLYAKSQGRAEQRQRQTEFTLDTVERAQEISDELQQQPAEEKNKRRKSWARDAPPS